MSLRARPLGTLKGLLRGGSSLDPERDSESIASNVSDLRQHFRLFQSIIMRRTSGKVDVRANKMYRDCVEMYVVFDALAERARGVSVPGKEEGSGTQEMYRLRSRVVKLKSDRDRLEASLAEKKEVHRLKVSLQCVPPKQRMPPIR